MIDIDALLQPIPGDDPAGADLRYEGTYDRIREARREDDANLPQGIWSTALKRADWDAVRDLATEALTRRAKDLQIAIWLAEALTRLDGLTGLARGLALIDGLCRQFWPSLHPRMEGGDLEYRLGAFYWLNEKLPLVLQELPVTWAETGNGRSYSWEDWQKAQRLDVMAQRDRKAFLQAEAAGEVTRPKFLQSVGLTVSAFYHDLTTASAAAVEALDRLDRTLTGLCGDAAPSLARLRQQIRQIDAFARHVLDERGDLMTADNADEAAPAVAETAPATRDADAGPVEILSAGPIRSRDEAYRRLIEIADYLLKTEPHSPTPYLIKRAVSWGNMTLGELLQELVIEERDLAYIYQLLGIRGDQGR